MGGWWSNGSVRREEDRGVQLVMGRAVSQVGKIRVGDGVEVGFKNKKMVRGTEIREKR